MKYQINEKFIMKTNSFLQCQNDRYIHFKELHRSFIELETKLKVMEEKFKINDSENN